MRPWKDWYAAYRHLKKRHGGQMVFLDYEVDMRPRWTDEIGNPHIDQIIRENQPTFEKNLSELANLDVISTIIEDAKELNWRNGYVPALDAFTLIWGALKAPKTYMEVGSGNSTMFVKAALSRVQSDVKIVSIDPYPRKEIDALCDEVIRSKLEDIDLTCFDRLEAGDVLFIDNSHRSFMNSDVTVSMLDVLPRLKPGVLVGFHDIMLPFDYPNSWSARAYSEQYLVASYLLANPSYFSLQFANHWIVRQQLHVKPLERYWAILGPDIRDRYPSAFWGYKS